MEGATKSKSSTCSKCGMYALKVSRSSYLDNHLSESVHAWIIGIIYGWLSVHNIGPFRPSPGGGRGKKLVNLQNVVFLHQMFLEVQNLTTTYGKAFKLKPCWLSCHNIGSQGPCLCLEDNILIVSKEQVGTSSPLPGFVGEGH